MSTWVQITIQCINKNICSCFGGAGATLCLYRDVCEHMNIFYWEAFTNRVLIWTLKIFRGKILLRLPFIKFLCQVHKDILLKYAPNLPKRPFKSKKFSAFSITKHLNLEVNLEIILKVLSIISDFKGSLVPTFSILLIYRFFFSAFC